jgi:serine/threonine protein kinase
MGTIYFAIDRGAEDKECVVKQPKNPVTSDAVLQHLRGEAQRMAALSRAVGYRMPEVLEEFVEDGWYYVVQQRIRGKTLEEVYNDKHPREEKEVIDWAMQCCRVLKPIHEHGVIYRDISPDNLMLTDVGDITFIDFGTPRELQRIITKGTVGIGKFGYSPPEQWAGKPVPQSDIFALGATSYFLLTGFLPPHSEQLQKYGNPQPSDFSPVFPPIRTLNPAVSPALEAILARALNLAIDKRYASPDDMRRDLEKLGKPVVPSKSVFCPKCGYENEPHLVYCRKCDSWLHHQEGPHPSETHWDVFVSYRRDRDAQTARLIRGELQRRGFSVFLDVDDLRPGHFDEALLERIQEAPNFIVILSVDSLDRCAIQDDWLRKEIVCALNNKKRVIPIMMTGFSFPPAESLPKELRSIRVHHGVNYSHEFFDAMMKKIVDYLGEPRTMSRVRVPQNDQLGVIASNRRRRVGISGSVGNRTIDWSQFCYLLGRAVAQTGYDVTATDAKGVGRSFYKGAMEFLKESRVLDVASRCVMVKIGTHDAAETRANRENQLVGIDACVFVGGGPGTIEEYRILSQHGTFCIPVGASGGAARRIYEEMQADSRSSSSRRAEHALLSSCEGPVEELVQATLRILSANLGPANVVDIR